MNICALIPARYEASRFPGKPLAEINDKPMIQYVYERSRESGIFDQVIVATDDQRILNTVREFGGQAVMTAKEHSSGTDRIAEVARNLHCQIVVNIQGDEPLVKKEMIEQAVEPFYDNLELPMATLKKEIKDTKKIKNPDIVKVVCDRKDNALYFSRAPVPHQRREEEKYYQHIGLYVFRRDFLLEFTSLAPTELEKTESLEQLRALENGYQIKVKETQYQSIGVDRPEDIELVEKELKAND